MKQLLVIIATTSAIGIVIAAGTYFAMTEGWLYAGACGGLLVVAYLYYSLALDNNWTLFRLSKPHEPDHPDLPGHESGHPIGVEEEVAIDRATYAGTDYEGLEEQNRW